MLLTNIFDNNDHNEENANDLFDGLVLVNPFTNVKENIEDTHAKKAKYESTDPNPETSNSIASCSKSLVYANRSIEETDRQYAEKLQLELNQETDPLSSSPSTAGIVSSLREFLKNLALKVDTTDQFFIVTRRGASLDRRLALWKIESLKSSPTKI